MNRCYEIYLYANRVLGTERIDTPPSTWHKGFSQIFPLVRDNNRITIVTNDENLGEPEARAFADAILRGEYTIRHTSFDQINAATKANPLKRKNGTR